MSPRKTFLVTCLVLSVLCLATGYGIAGQWMGAAAALLMAPAWWLARKYPRSWLPFVCLLGSVGFAAAGSLIGSPPAWMIFASAASLTGWDLLYLDAALGNPSAVGQTRQYEKVHLRSLMLAVGGGLLGAALGRFLDIQIPFVVVLLFIIVILFALDRVGSDLKRAGRT